MQRPVSLKLDTALDRMTAAWQVVLDGGKTRVLHFKLDEINGQTRRVAELVSCADFKNFFATKNQKFRRSFGQ